MTNSATSNAFTNAQPSTTDSIWKSISKVPKSKKIIIMRTIFTIILIGYFCLTLYLGPFAIIFTTLAIQIKCFLELMNIASNLKNLPWFRPICLYFLIAANYFFCGEYADYFAVFIDKFNLKVCFRYHRFKSFLFYLVGFACFMLTLKKKYDKRQFALLAWTHVALFVVVSQSYMVIKNIFQGLIWVTFCVTSVACNDTMAYLCGKLLGKTPLIKVSPKKTWEGFIGGGIFTIIYGFLISWILCRFQYFVCPIEYKETIDGIVMVTDCERSSLFKLKNYTVEGNFGSLYGQLQLKTYPFVLHTFWLSLFCSSIAPFGGFFASGFKRAFNAKDFGQVIPGHGGILDRFDCQIFMTTFVNVYISSFVKTPSVQKIFSKILLMSVEEQLSFFYMMQEMLHKNGLNTNYTNEVIKL